MMIKIVAVHPAVTMVETEGQQREIPTAWFPMKPKVGQQWTLAFEHIPSESEKLDTLNRYLARD